MEKQTYTEIKNYTQHNTCAIFWLYRKQQWYSFMSQKYILYFFQSFLFNSSNQPSKNEINNFILNLIFFFKKENCLSFICRYFKRFNIPDMDRAKLKLEQSAISAAHANNTLIITVSLLKAF